MNLQTDLVQANLSVLLPGWHSVLLPLHICRLYSFKTDLRAATLSIDLTVKWMALVCDLFCQLHADWCVTAVYLRIGEEVNGMQESFHSDYIIVHMKLSQRLKDFFSCPYTYYRNHCLMFWPWVLSFGIHEYCNNIWWRFWTTSSTPGRPFYCNCIYKLL